MNAKMKNYTDIHPIHSSDMSCPLKVQYCESDYGLYVEYESTYNSKEFNNFYQLCKKMNPIQRRFFLEPTSLNDDDDGKRFVFCPGYDLASFYFTRKAKESCYKSLLKTDKLYIMEWIFSIACGVKILLENDFEIINIFDKSFFIDSNMNARLSYASWETEYEIFSTLLISQYFQAPEKKSNDTNQKSTIEKQCSYSLGVLMSALLNKRLPNVYFPRTSSDEINKKLQKGEIYRNNVPECKWKKIILDCLNVKNPLERPNIDSIIEFIIKEDNCLEDVDYSKFQKFILNIFDCDEKTDFSQFYKEKISPNLTKISENAESSIHADILTVSDISQFLELSKGTSFEQGINESCKKLLQNLCKKLSSEELKNKFILNEALKNPYELMDDLLRYTSDDNEDEYINDNPPIPVDKKRNILDVILNLLYFDNMNDNSAFYLRINKKNGKITFVIPEELELPDDYYDHFHDNKYFVHITNKFCREIAFYPFLNVYNVLYGNSSKYSFNILEKIKWLYQTAEALSLLHEQKYTLKYFNSTNVFIDLNLDAHLFPSQIIKNQPQLNWETDYFEQPDFILSYIAPELISDVGSISEKQVVYSFGVFILELIYENRPGQFLKNLSISEKKNLLLKKRKIFINQDDSLFQLVQSCLDQSPEKRKSFKDIVSDLTDILKKAKKFENDNKNENKQSFYFDDLEEASNKGATIPDIIFDYIYNTFDLDKILAFDDFKTKYSNRFSKYKLLWTAFVNGAIEDNDLNAQTPKVKKVKVRKKMSENQNIKDPTKSQFNSFNNYTLEYINNFHVTMKKVHNKPVPLVLHLNGLSLPSARHMVLRNNYNIDEDYRKQTEYSVRNQYDQPYGDVLKMKNVEDIVNDMIQKGVFRKNTEKLKTNKGNVLTDSQVI